VPDSSNKSRKGLGGLGKGFASLIPEDFDSSLLVGQEDRVQKLLISDITPNAEQPRTTFEVEGLEELASSIRQHGILQPIIVRVNSDGNYVIVAGERRWRAAQIAGLTHVPAIVRSLEELEQLEIALIENVQRADLSPLDQATAIQRLHNQFSVAYADIATRLGKAFSTVTNTVRLLDLPEESQQALRDNLITEGHARAIVALKDQPEKQAELLQFILKNHWTVRQAEQFVVATKKGGHNTTVAKERLETTNPATEKLSKSLGAPVNIRRTAKGGKLEIKFTSDTQLNTLLRKLGKK
jgi:ParB family chromosome partitioning protein